MKPKIIIKIIVDMMMTILLLFLMSYSMIGEKQHEVIGVTIFVLFVLHHILNNNFCRNLFRGRYSAYRIFQTLLIVLIFISMIGSMISGIILSRYVFSWITIKGLGGTARKLHMLSAYWGFLFMSIHLGLHWGMICNMVKRMIPKTNVIVCRLTRIIGFAIAVYGVYAFIKRKLMSYLFLRDMFVFFDFKESIIYFILDYAAIMGFFVFCGFYLSEGVKRLSLKSINKN